MFAEFGQAPLCLELDIDSYDGPWQHVSRFRRGTGWLMVAKCTIQIHAVSALRKVLLEDDHIARIGGDEFLVFLRFASDPERLEDCQRLLIDAIDILPWQVTASAGGIVLPLGHYPEPSKLIQLADDLMYDVKRSGRGRLDLQHLSDLNGAMCPLTAPEDETNF